jgi:protein deglycase
MRRASSLRRVLVPIATGSEELEAVTIVDTLVRAGANVTLASVENNLQVLQFYERS